jgi:hypothetical protein
MTDKTHRNRLQRFVLAALGCLCAVGNSSAQPYSAGLEDANNPHDAPVPGFAEDGSGVNPLFLAWADSVADYSQVTDAEGNPVVDPFWGYSGEALGPVTGDNFAIVSLGDLSSTAIQDGRSPGSLTVSFAEPIRNFSGADFAVFENGFISGSDQGGTGVGGVFAELAYVEVSSNGVNFARFDSISLTDSAVGPYGSIDPTAVFNLAGKHVNAGGESWGTPFDLDELAGHSLVQAGQLDLDAITHIRLVDIPGSGDFLDSLGNPIYDAWVTWGSGGADIEALGAIGQPQSYAEWAQLWGVAGEAQSADTDEDGFSNLAEYALALDPSKADGGGSTRIEVDDSGQRWFVFRRDERNSEAVMIVEAQSNGLNAAGWTEVARFGPLTASQLTGPLVEAIEVRSVAPQASVGVLQEVALRLSAMVDGERSRFLRVRIEPVEP